VPTASGEDGADAGGEGEGEEVPGAGGHAESVKRGIRSRVEVPPTDAVGGAEDRRTATKASLEIDGAPHGTSAVDGDGAEREAGGCWIGQADTVLV